MQTKTLTTEARMTMDVERAFGLTILALDRSRSQEERDELTAEAWALLSGIATD